MLRISKSSIDSDFESIGDAGQVMGSRLPAAEHRKNRMHSLQRLVTDPLNTYYFEAASDEMELFGIKQGTLLVVDRSKNPVGGMVVIAWHDGEWLVRQLISHVEKKYLTTGKEEEMLEIKDNNGIVIWGVVTWSCCPQNESACWTRRIR